MTAGRVASAGTHVASSALTRLSRGRRRVPGAGRPLRKAERLREGVGRRRGPSGSPWTGSGLGPWGGGRGDVGRHRLGVEGSSKEDASVRREDIPTLTRIDRSSLQMVQREKKRASGS